MKYPCKQIAQAQILRASLGKPDRTQNKTGKLKTEQSKRYKKQTQLK
jgi:hypothetical protein